MSDGLLDRLGLGALAGFAVGVAVASSPGDQRSLQEFARATLAECLRLLDDPRLAAVLPAAVTPAPLASVLSPSAPEALAETSPTETPRPRRRRRTRAEIEADATAAAAVPATEAEPPPRRRGRPPGVQSPAAAGVTDPAPEPASFTGEGLPPAGLGSGPDQPQAESGETPSPRRRGRPAAPRPTPVEATEATTGNGASTPDEPPLTEEPRQSRDEGEDETGFAALPIDPAPAAPAAEPPPATDGKLNLNTATRAEILRLPRIGAQAADRILAFREEQGRISGARELRRADVVSAAQWRQIRELVRF